MSLSQILFLKYSKSSRISRVSKEGGWVIFGRVSSAIGALFGVRIITEILEPSAYGELALGMTIASFVQIILFGPLQNGAARFYAPACELDDIHSYLSSIKRLALILTGFVIIFAIFIIFSAVFYYDYDIRWLHIGAIALIFALFSGYNGIINGIQNAARHRSIVAIHTCLETWLRFSIGAAFMFLLGRYSVVAMAGYVISSLIIFASQCIFLKNLIKKAIRSKKKRNDNSYKWQLSIFTYSWPFATWGVLVWGRMVSDRWFLELYSSTSKVGLYAVLYQIGYYPISLIIGMVLTYLTPIYFQHTKDTSDLKSFSNVHKYGYKIAWIALFCTVILSFLCFLLHKPLFSLFVAKEYSVISSLLPLMVLSAGTYESSKFFSVLFQVHKNTKALIIPNNVSHVIGIIMVLIGAAKFEIRGVIYANVIYSFIHFMWFSHLLRRVKYPSQSTG